MYHFYHVDALLVDSIHVANVPQPRHYLQSTVPTKNKCASLSTGAHPPSLPTPWPF